MEEEEGENISWKQERKRIENFRLRSSEALAKKGNFNGSVKKGKQRG